MNLSPRHWLGSRKAAAALRRRRRFPLEVGRLEGRMLLATDITAPTTTATVIRGHLGNNDFYTTPVAIRLSATDPDNASSTLKTYYEVDNGPLTRGNSLTLGDGTHILRFYSVDPAGNIEPTHALTFRIDTTAPQVTAGANPSTLWPPDHKLVPVTVTGRVSDASGGIPRSVSYQVYDEYGQVHPSGSAAVRAGGNYSFVAYLEASRLGQDKDGRLYSIVVTATDQAGNTGSATTYVTVPHDQGNHNGSGGDVGGHGHGTGHGKGNGH
jgi:hypothetical protein